MVVVGAFCVEEGEPRARSTPPTGGRARTSLRHWRSDTRSRRISLFTFIRTPKVVVEVFVGVVAFQWVRGHNFSDLAV
jgi:hypothetical protein